MSSVAISGAVGDVRGQFRPDTYRSGFVVGEIRVEAQGDSAELVKLGPQLEAFAADVTSPDIELRIEWRPRLEAARGRELFHSGSLWSVHSFQDGFLFDFATERLGQQPYKRLLTDMNFARAQVLLSRECLASVEKPSAFEYPLDELLITHYLSLGRGVELHACGLVSGDGGSFLFAGHSGAGKSTMARLWTRHVPVRVLSDDRIIVRRKASFSGAVGGRECSPCKFFMYGTPWHGEAAFASPAQAPLRRVFLLEHGSENTIERLSKSAAVGELLARSFVPFYQPRFVDPVLALLEELAESVPCYRFRFIPDRSAVERIREFRD